MKTPLNKTMEEVPESAPVARRRRLRLCFFNSLLVLCLLLLLAESGCTTRSSANARSQAAFAAGLQQATTSKPTAPPITFRGDVKNFRVPWTEGLTLAQALIAAEYTGHWDPHTIVITRNGQPYNVNPKRLLSGLEDPLLEPGDTVEIHH